MKMMIVAMAVLFSFNSIPAFADDAKNTEAKVNEATAPKSSRKKKVEMCKECGKPESQCECEGKEHGKKDDKKS